MPILMKLEVTRWPLNLAWPQHPSGRRRGRPASSCCHLVPPGSSIWRHERIDTGWQHPGRRTLWQ